MLQYVTIPNNQYPPIDEQCQMVLEGGCRWIQLRLPDYLSETELLEELERIVDMCRENQAFLVVENNTDLADKLRLHGVHITRNSGLNPSSVREQLGPHAVIGVDVENFTDIEHLKDKDIDYVTLPDSIPNTDRLKTARDALSAGNTIPVVLSGNVNVNNLAEVFDSGVSGICLGQEIMDSADPVSFTADLLTRLPKQ